MEILIQLLLNIIGCSIGLFLADKTRDYIYKRRRIKKDKYYQKYLKEFKEKHNIN